MDINPISFDQLPKAVYELGQKVDNLTGLLQAMAGQKSSNPDRWFSVEELSDYLPGHPAVTTLYGKVQRRELPFSRNGKRLVFRQSDIDFWLQSRRVKTSAELNIIAEQHIDQHNSFSHKPQKKVIKRGQKGGQLK